MKNNFIRMIALTLSFILITGLTACGKSVTSSDSSDSVNSVVSDNSGNTSSGSSSGEASVSEPKKVQTAVSGLTEAGSEVKADDYKLSADSSIESRINLKGKTLKMAVFNTINYTSSAFKRKIKAFEAQYGCTVKISSFAFGSAYTKAVSNSVAAGDPYDIAFMQGSWFYNAISSNAYQPLNKSISKEDILTSDFKGIDLTKSAECSWNGNLYGVCGYQAVNPMLIFYNKKMFNDAGLEDPRTLYDSGKWTWSKFIEMGLQVTDSSNNQWFGEYNFFRPEVVATYGGSPITFKNGIPSASISQKNYINGLKLIQTLGYGSNKVIKTQGNEDQLQDFFDGKTYVYLEESDRYVTIMNKISGLNAFASSGDNLGIVPLPLGGSNKAYPTGWIEVAASPNGSDPNNAVAWAKFSANYNDPVKNDITVMNSKDHQLILNLLSDILPRRCGYSDSSNSMSELEWNLCTDTANVGKDISASVKSYGPQMQSCIDATLSNLSKIK